MNKNVPKIEYISTPLIRGMRLDYFESFILSCDFFLFWTATENGDLNLVEQLIKNSVDINDRDSNNENALSWGKRFFKWISFLIEKSIQ
jgi:ankyrin repeat protein